MFNSQHWQIKLVYAGFGGFLMFIGMLLSPVTAQRDKFGNIECTSLTVVDAEGNAMGRLGIDLHGDRRGGYVRVWGRDRGEQVAGVAQLTADANGGRLDVYGIGDIDSKSIPSFLAPKSRASVSVGSSGGGLVFVNDGYPVGKRGYLMVDKIGIWGKGDGEKKGGSAQLSVNANGGRLHVYGTVDNSTRATVQVNQHGNGAVATWNNDGEKFHTLGELIRAPSSVSVPSVTTVGDVIESKIDGDFEGWDGETVVKLTNGQIWKQTQYHYEYHYAFMPDVLIYKSGSRYKMLVEGTDEAVYVERLE